jgi:hypothetical protein
MSPQEKYEVMTASQGVAAVEGQQLQHVPNTSTARYRYANLLLIRVGKRRTGALLIVSLSAGFQPKRTCWYVGKGGRV